MLRVRSPRRVTRQLVGTVVALLATAALAQAQSVAPVSSSSPTAPKSVVPSRKTNGSAARSAMDLHAPPLNHIYPSRELRYMLEPDDSADPDTIAEVSVSSSRYVMNVPVAPGNQLQAIPWALLHPTQAWRIFTPLEQQP